MRRRRRRSMIFLINFSGNRYFLKLLLVSVFLSGCAVAPVAAPEYRIDLSAGMKSLITVMPVENLAGMAGNDAPGFLLLGLVNDPRALWEKAKDRVVNSLTEYLSGRKPKDSRKVEKKFLPKSFRGLPPKPPDGKETFSVAVLPFRDASTRRNAGEILALHS